MSRLLVALTPYAVSPARHGPQVRVAGILGNLGEGWEVVHFSQSIQRTDLPWPPAAVRGGPRWVEHRLRDPLSAAWLVGLAKLGGYPAAYADRLLGLFPRPRLIEWLARADAVLVSPHYQFPWVRAHTPAATGVAVDLHCVEADVWPARGSGWSRRVAAEIAAGEPRSWREADLVLVTCAEEAARVGAAGAREVALVANGVDTERIRPAASAAERVALRRALGLPGDGCLAVFVGSGGYANREAVDALTAQLPHLAAGGVHLAVVGRAGLGRRPRPGVTWAGEVDDVAGWLAAADIALCPLARGSGTSLKSVEYLAAGLPLVSTAVGVRGLGLTPGVEAEVVGLGEVAPAAVALAADPGRRRALGAAARRAAVDRFDWSAIGAAAAAALVRMAERSRPQSSGASAATS